MKTATTISDIVAVPFFSQFTEVQIRNQITISAEGLRNMQAKAVATGRKVGGFTAAQLDADAARFEKMIA